jgi:hypothetical protein
VIDDLASIGEPGVRNLVKTGQEFWTCKACGDAIDVHHGRCSV